MNIRHWQLPPLVETAPKIIPLMLYLMTMLRIGRDFIKINCDCCYFIGGFQKSLLPLIGIDLQDTKSYFGGDVRWWSGVFSCFFNHFFILFNSIVSGWSIEMWGGKIETFKQVILDLLNLLMHSNRCILKILGTQREHNISLIALLSIGVFLVV